jgi:hypothetical protein
MQPCDAMVRYYGSFSVLTYRMAALEDAVETAFFFNLYVWHPYCTFHGIGTLVIGFHSPILYDRYVVPSAML